MTVKKIALISMAAVIIIGFSLLEMASSQTKPSTKSPNLSRILAKIDLNKATAEELGKFPGLNAELGKAIVEYRSKSGPFKTPEDLLKVKGMTKEILNKIKPKVEKDILYIVPGNPDEDEEDEPSLKPSKC
jgi:competence ComEA-like helix-hairpin-helix protein